MIFCVRKMMRTGFSENRIALIRTGVWLAGIFFTLIYGVQIYKACEQRKEEWDNQAKAAFLEAVGKELDRAERVHGDQDGMSVIIARHEEVFEIPDSVSIETRDGHHVYHLSKYRRDNAFTGDGLKNAFYSTVLEQCPILSDTLLRNWDSLLVSHQVKAELRVCSRVTDEWGHIRTDCADAAGIPVDSLVTTYLGYRLEMEATGYVGYRWWSLLPVEMLIRLSLCWLVCMSLLYGSRFMSWSGVKSRPVLVTGEAVEEPEDGVGNGPDKQPAKVRVYSLGNGISFDARRRVFCNESGRTESLSPVMSVLLEQFFQSPGYSMTRYEIYSAIGKTLDSYPLDSFYKLMSRFRSKLEHVSSATLVNDGNGVYRLVVPVQLSDTY